MSKPDFLLRVFERVCPPSLYESIEGDLLEQFESDKQTLGIRKAKWRLKLNVIRFMRPGILMRNKFSVELNLLDMLVNHVRVAIRHLFRNKIFTAINVAGLAIGIAAFFLIAQYVAFETTYDQFHENHKNICRVAYQQLENGDVKNSSAGTFFEVGQFMKENFEETEEFVHFYKWPASTGTILRVDGKIFNERNYLFAEPAFFKIFSSQLIQGNVEKCLSDPNSIVLSQSLAIKMFGTEDVMGKSIAYLENKGRYLTVTGVMKDFPANSHFDLDLVIPFELEWIPEKNDHWKYPNNWTYLTLKSGTEIRQLQAKLNAALDKTQKDNPQWKGASLIIQPITDIHLNSHWKNDELKTNGSMSQTYGIGAVAIIILFIAWINYVNLETSKFLIRMKEVSIRRLVGSTKWQLVAQFFIQYTCLNVLALIIAAITICLVLPYYQFVTGIPVASMTFLLSESWMIAGLIFIAGAFVTGIFPALFFLKFNPIRSLKNQLHGTPLPLFRKSLVTFQFIASLVLIAFLFVVNDQLDYMRIARKSLDVDQVLTVYNSTSYTYIEDSLKKDRSLGFRNRILQNPDFINLSTSSAVPGEPVGFTYENFTKRSLSDPDDGIPYKVLFVDYYFLPVYSLKLKAGRNYSEDSGEDNNLNSLVLNESAIRALGFKSAEEALNQEIYFMVTFDWKKYKIIGIVEDYNHESVKAPVQPTVFFLHKYVGQMTYYSLLVNKGTNMTDVVAFAEKTWKEFWPEKPFNYFFMDQHYDQQYKAEVYFSRIFSLFAGVAIFLAGLGVLGMTLFESNSRLRELSIRKVLGASVVNLVTLLSRSHFRLMLLAVLISAPLIYYMANEWLSRYPVRIEFSIWFWALPVMVVAATVFCTSGIQLFKAANTNPINHLKSE